MKRLRVLVDAGIPVLTAADVAAAPLVPVDVAVAPLVPVDAPALTPAAAAAPLDLILFLFLSSFAPVVPALGTTTTTPRRAPVVAADNFYVRYTAQTGGILTPYHENVPSRSRPGWHILFYKHSNKSDF